MVIPYTFGQTAAIMVAMFVASFVQGTSGVGFSMICMAVLPLIVPYRLSAQTALALTVLFSAATLVRAEGKVRVRLVLVPLAFTFVGGLFGFWTLLAAPAELLGSVLGLAIVLFSLFSLVSKNQLSFPDKPVWAAFFGTLSGFFSGVAGIGGPPLVAYYLGVFKTDKDGYFSTLALSYLLGACYQLSLHVAARTVGTELLVLVGLSVLPLALGYSAGRRLFAKVDHRVLRNIVNGIMMVMGLSILLHAVSA